MHVSPEKGAAPRAGCGTSLFSAWLSHSQKSLEHFLAGDNLAGDAAVGHGHADGVAGEGRGVGVAVALAQAVAGGVQAGDNVASHVDDLEVVVGLDAGQGHEARAGGQGRSGGRRRRSRPA